MAVFNGEKQLEQQIASILDQSLGRIELVISDDCSTDQTIKVINKFQRDPRIRLLKNRSRVGPAANFERAIGQCRCEFIALSDQDDIWRVDKLERLLQSIEDCDLVYSDARLIDAAGVILADSMRRAMHLPVLEGNPWRELLFFNFVTGCTAMIRKRLFLRARPFPSGIVYHDRWLAFEAARGAGIASVDQSLIDYRLHGENHTGIGQFKSLPAMIDALRPSVQNGYFARLRKDGQAWMASNRLHGEELNLAQDADRCYDGKPTTYPQFLAALWRNRRYMFVSNRGLIRPLKLAVHASMWPLRRLV